MGVRLMESKEIAEMIQKYDLFKTINDWLDSTNGKKVGILATIKIKVFGQNENYQGQFMGLS